MSAFADLAFRGDDEVDGVVDRPSRRLNIGRAILAISDPYEQALFTHAGQVAAGNADVR